MGIQSTISVDPRPANAGLQEFERTVSRTRDRIAAADRGMGSAGAGGAKTNMGSGLLQVSQFADDAQYGLKSVVNQIPLLLMSFGLGAGLAGAVQIAAVGVNLLMNAFKGNSSAQAENIVKTNENALAKQRLLAKEGLVTDAVEKQTDALKWQAYQYSRRRDEIADTATTEQRAGQAALELARARAESLDDQATKVRELADLAKAQAALEPSEKMADTGRREASATARAVALAEERAAAEKDLADATDAREKARQAASAAGLSKNFAAHQNAQRAAVMAAGEMESAEKRIALIAAEQVKLAEERHQLFRDRQRAAQDIGLLEEKNAAIEIRAQRELQEIEAARQKEKVKARQEEMDATAKATREGLARIVQQQEYLQQVREELDLAEAKNSKDKKRAAQMEKEFDIQRRMKELMEKGGLSEADARAMAQRQQRAAGGSDRHAGRYSPEESEARREARTVRPFRGLGDLAPRRATGERSSITPAATAPAQFPRLDELKRNRVPESERASREKKAGKDDGASLIKAMDELKAKLAPIANAAAKWSATPDRAA